MRKKNYTNHVLVFSLAVIAALIFSQVIDLTPPANDSAEIEVRRGADEAVAPSDEGEAVVQGEHKTRDTRIQLHPTNSLFIDSMPQAPLSLRRSENQDSAHKKEPRGTQPDEAARFRRLQMQDEKGRIPLDGLEKARKQMSRMRAFQQKRAAAAGQPEGMAVAGLEHGDWT